MQCNSTRSFYSLPGPTGDSRSVCSVAPRVLSTRQRRRAAMLRAAWRLFWEHPPRKHVIRDGRVAWRGDVRDPRLELVYVIWMARKDCRPCNAA